MASLVRKGTVGAYLVFAEVPLAVARVDTEDLFGFTQGSDIGIPFHPEVEVEVIGRLGRKEGAYSATGLGFSLEYPLTSWLRIAPVATVTHFGVAGVPDMEDRANLGLEGLGIEFRLRPLDRAHHQVGLTFVAQPFVGTVDSVTGVPVDSWGSVFLVAADRELIPGALFAAANMACDFAVGRNYSGTQSVDGSGLAFSLAATAKIGEGSYVGAEIRYSRVYDGLALDELVDQAIYLGPTFNVSLGPGVSLSGAWNVQLWNQPKGIGLEQGRGVMDDNLFKLRLGLEF